MPPDANVVKDLMKQNLLGVFSEHDAENRRALIAKIWDSKGIFIDPEGRYVGHTAINDAAEQLQRRFPDFAFSEVADGDANSGVAMESIENAVRKQGTVSHPLGRETRESPQRGRNE